MNSYRTVPLSAPAGLASCSPVTLLGTFAWATDVRQVSNLPDSLTHRPLTQELGVQPILKALPGQAACSKFICGSCFSQSGGCPGFVKAGCRFLYFPCSEMTNTATGWILNSQFR